MNSKNYVRLVIVGETLADVHDKILEMAKTLYASDASAPTQNPNPQMLSVSTADASEAPVVPTPAINNGTLRKMAAARASADFNGVDSRGLPWDERIHASSRAKNKDGTWRYRRGLDEREAQAVEQELVERVKAAQVEEIVDTSTVAPSSFVPPAPVESETPVPFGPPTFVVPVEEPAPVPTYENVPTPAAQPDRPAHTFETFKSNFVQVFSTLMNSGIITPQYLQEIKDYFKVQEVFELYGDETKLRELFDNFCSGGLITKLD
jgi:hypothetical protein